MSRHIAFLLFAALAMTQPVAAQDIDFGDDASAYANDGECDDKRFEGPGMTTTLLLDADVGHDATDCRTAFEAGTLSLAGDAPSADAQPPAEIDFGDDASQYANDNECDDKRFDGPGMTATILLDEDVGHDATDCRTAFEAGQLSLREPATGPQIVDGIDFGDDASSYANDNECDDKRFTGAGMTTTALLDSDVGHDATDCRTAYEAGRLSLADEPEADTSAGGPQVVDGIDFGDDASTYANDGECDDMRFEGPGMTTTMLLDGDVGHDATDCRTAYEAGDLWLDGDGAVRGGAQRRGSSRL